MWSKELQNTTRNNIFPGAVMKNLKFDFGIFNKKDGKILIMGIKSASYIPIASEEIVATFDNIDQMIDAGWVMD
ncbi:MAG: hypothetical protein K5866_07800 [Treponema sp.]|nr:hypothetical protein [Treponema sp.]